MPPPTLHEYHRLELEDLADDKFEQRQAAPHKDIPVAVLWRYRPAHKTLVLSTFFALYLGAMIGFGLTWLVGGCDKGSCDCGTRP